MLAKEEIFRLNEIRRREAVRAEQLDLELYALEKNLGWVRCIEAEDAEETNWIYETFGFPFPAEIKKIPTDQLGRIARAALDYASKAEVVTC
jgi:hypothetical protein